MMNLKNVIVKPCATRTRSYRGQPRRLEVGWDSNVFNSLTTVAKDSMILEIRIERDHKDKGS